MRCPFGTIVDNVCSVEKRMSLRTSAHTGVAPSGDSLRSQSVFPWLPLWGSWRRSRLRGQKSPSPPPAPLPEGEARPSSVTASPCHRYIIVQLPLAVIRILIRCAEHHPEGEGLENGLPRRPMASSQRHTFFASALKTERYRAVPSGLSNSDQLCTHCQRRHAAFGKNSHSSALPRGKNVVH